MTALALGLVAGAGLGALHFGGLWWSVRRIPHARRPGLTMATGYLVRLCLLGAGLYAVTRFGGGGALVAALFGLLGARQALVRKLGAPEPGASAPPPRGRRRFGCNSPLTT